jgi:microcompartment protein CcmK/EutM
VVAVLVAARGATKRMKFGMLVGVEVAVDVGGAGIGITVLVQVGTGVRVLVDTGG